VNIGPANARAEPDRTIISPWVDALCVGGGSLMILLPLLLAREEALLQADAKALPWLDPVKAWASLLINMPHFLASYRMVYRSKETILRHPWASIYVPLFLSAYSCFAVWQAQEDVFWLALLAIVSGGYLAWHYTGQAWGMMSVYAHLAGTPFDRVECRLIRGGLRILLVWHVAWFFYWGSEFQMAHRLVTPVYEFLTQCTLFSVALGICGLARYARRTGRMPPIRSLLPWGAIFVWYAAMARHPGAIFWVQIAHAIQYLIFPLRVEWNRSAARPGAEPRLIWRHMLMFAAALLGIGFVLGEFVPDTANDLVKNFLGTQAGAAAMMAPNFFLNIHHYFTDGCVWKLRDPEVRRDLFGHLPKRA
jgi:hypothetical protein